MQHDIRTTAQAFALSFHFFVHLFISFNLSTAAAS
jgi:hypothetical protein